MSRAEKREAREVIIENLLRPLTDEALLELSAIMYIGRDHRRYPLSLVRWKKHLLALRADRGECYRVLMEKPGAPKYLAWRLRAIGCYPLRI